jgi:hypothetical protein
MAESRRLLTMPRRCPHLDCRLAGITFCQYFGGRVVRLPVYVVWATPAHPEKPMGGGAVKFVRECLRVSAYAESRRLADLLAELLMVKRFGPLCGHKPERVSDGDY